MSKFEQMAEQNDIFRIMRDGSGYVGIVYHPDTGVPIKKFHSGNEAGLRLQLIRYVYTTIPTSCEEE